MSFHLAAVLFCFLASVVIRAPNLNRPLSDHHEWVTAQTMIALQNLHAQGALRHRFVPIQTYPLPADKFVYDLGIKVHDENGNGYYTSLPPFSVIAPYLLFTALSLDFSVLNLQLFNLAGHLFATLLLYFTLCRVLSRGSSPHTASAVGAATFIFLAPNLWYYSNVYSWDTFWHYLWVAGILCVIRISDAIQHSRLTIGSLVLLGLVIFFITYSEYQGLIFGGCVAAWGLRKKRQSSDYARVALIAAGTAFLALCLTVYQYSSQVGPEVFAKSVMQTAGHRRYLGDYQWLQIAASYGRGVPYLLLPVVVMAGVWMRWGRREWIRKIHEDEWLFLYLSVVPVVIHHLLLPQWTAEHDYSIVKTLVFLAALIAWLFQKTGATPGVPRMGKVAVWTGLVAALGGSLYVYQFGFARTAETSRYQDLGHEIAAALDSEVVFAVSAESIVPQVIYYAQRNIQTVAGKEDALLWLKHHGRDKGRLFYVDSAYKLMRAEPLRLE